MGSSTDVEESRRRGWTQRALGIAGAVVRILLGLMFLATGRLWLTRDDPSAYLTNAIEPQLAAGVIVGLYAPFVESVILPNAGAFAALATVGELLVGTSLLTGAFARAGCLGGVFLMVNYSLALGNSFLPPIGNPLLAIVLLALYTSAPGRTVGLDEWIRLRLHGRRWLDFVT